MKKWLLVSTALLVGGGLAIGAGLAQTVFPLQSSVTGTEYIANALNPTGAYFTTKQIATYVGSSGAGSGVNAQTGTTYTFVSADCGKLVTFSNGSPVAAALPQAGASFPAGCSINVENKNSGAVTITPATSTINGAATLVLNQNRGSLIRSDGTNYQVQAGGASFLTTPLAVAEGGTGAATLTTGGVVIAHGASPLTATVTPSGLTSVSATTVNAGASGTAGTLAVFPATASDGSTTFTAANNAGNTVTNVATAAQSGARTYTIPDQGGNAAFLMTGATRSATTGLTATRLVMTGMRTAAGLMMTGSASSTNYGLTYTPATGTFLVGTATSSSTTGNTAAYDFVLPANYIAGTDITLSVSCHYTEASGSTSAHTMAAAAYLNAAAGTQGSTLIATAAQVCPITTSAAQTFTITGATLSPGSYLSLTFTAALTNGSGASTEFLDSVSIN